MLSNHFPLQLRFQCLQGTLLLSAVRCMLNFASALVLLLYISLTFNNAFPRSIFASTLTLLLLANILLYSWHILAAACFSSSPLCIGLSFFCLSLSFYLSLVRSFSFISLACLALSPFARTNFKSNDCNA